jgi:hydroxyacylglutathione hydrolase
MARNWIQAWKKTKTFCGPQRNEAWRFVHMQTIPLEDELGDVLEKGLRCAGLTVEDLSRLTEVPLARLRDAIDYRSDLSAAELVRIARTLGLNEVGLCALGGSGYPSAQIGSLPFCVKALHMRHGIGVANAFLVTECGANHGILFDVGPGFKVLMADWPAEVSTVDAIFLTHAETEHAGGLQAAMRHFCAAQVFHPAAINLPCGVPVEEPKVISIGAFEIRVLSTPGHAHAHNCYLVTSRAARSGNGLLIAGDLVFAGSAGGGYYCPKQSQGQLRRVIDLVSPETVIAPGHGPLTTASHERRYNPFLG